MPISTINRVKTIAIPLTVDDANNTKIIYSSPNYRLGEELIPDHKIISSNSFIKNLKVYAQIGSLPRVNLPEFEITDSETQKLQKVLNVEYTSARKQIDLFVGTVSGWFSIGSISLLNPNGYPYRVYNLMDLFTDTLALELGQDCSIATQVREVGYGLLESEDSVTVHGSYVEEFFVQSPDIQPIINVYVSGVGTTVPPDNFSLGDTGYIDDQTLIGD